MSANGAGNPGAPPSWAARLAAIQAAEQAGEWARVRELGDALWTDAMAAGQAETAVSAVVAVARVRANHGDLPAAAELLTLALADPRAAQTGPAQADAWVLLAGVRASLGDGPAAAHAVQRALALLAGAEVGVEQRQRAYNGLSVAYYQLGLSHQAMHMARESVRLLPPDTQDGPGMLRRLNLAMMLVVLHDESAYLPDGQPEEDWLTQAQAQLDAVPAGSSAVPRWLQIFHGVLQASLWRRCRRPEPAVDRLREALQDAAPVPASLTRYARLELAQSLAMHGSTREEARAMAEQLLREAREAPGASTSMWQLENIAQLAELAERHDEALQALNRAVAQLRRNVTALIDGPAAGLGGQVEAQALKLFNDDLVARNQQLSQAVQDVSRAALFDALTGIFNRRGLGQEFKRVQGRGSFAVALVDVDHFKAINDGHSHLVGDGVLRRLGALLQDMLRVPDVVGRWGGEEFLILLDGTRAPDALAIAERLRERIAVTAWHELAPALRVTVSIGVAEAGPDEDFEAVVERADAALYRAKNGGRDRVCGPPEPPPAGS